MFRDFLWLVHAKQNYDMQKNTQGVGLIGFGIIVLMIWKWDEWFYPLFNTLGLVGLASRVGLIREGFPVMTIINVIGMIFLVSLVCSLIAFVGYFLFLFLFGSVFAEKFWVVVLTIVAMPFLGVYWLVLKRQNDGMTSVYKQDKDRWESYTKARRSPKVEMMSQLYAEQLNDDKSGSVQVFTQEDTKNHLNRAVASVNDDTDWIIARSKDFDTKGKWFVLCQNPMPYYASNLTPLPDEEIDYIDYCRTLTDYRTDKGSLDGEKSNGYETNEYNGVQSFYSYRTGAEHLHVPAIEIQPKWSKIHGEIIPSLNAQNTVELSLQSINSMSDFFRVKKDVVKELFKQIASNHAVHEMLNTSHVFSYVIPYMVKEELDYRINGEAGYFKESENIKNIDVFAPIYQADIAAYVKECASKDHYWAKESLYMFEEQKENY